MLPKEKAEEIYNNCLKQFSKIEVKKEDSYWYFQKMLKAKILSLKHVNEILKILKSLKATRETLKEYRYYLEVKTEINKL